MSGERGSILAQVLITAAVASLLCASILRSRLQPALTTARAVDRVRDDLAASGALNRVEEVWARRGACSTDSTVGVRCGGAGCRCRCSVFDPDTGAPAATVESAPPPAGETCRLSSVPE